MFMTDGVIKGSGNSRYLKTVSNAKTLYPTYDDFLAALIAGTLPIDLNGINPAGWKQQGTPLDKGSLLKDQTAAILDLDETAVPDDVLSLLSRFHKGLGSEYVWGRYSKEPVVALEQYSTSVSAHYYAKSSSEVASTITYSDKVDMAGNLVNPQSIVVSYGTYSNLNVVKGKYWKSTHSSANIYLFYTPADAADAAQSSNSSNNFVDIAAYKCAVALDETTVSYVQSPDASAYPPAEDDGYLYISLGRVGGGVREVRLITYVGNGSTSRSLNVGHDAKFVVMLGGRKTGDNYQSGYQDKFVLAPSRDGYILSQIMALMPQTTYADDFGFGNGYTNSYLSAQGYYKNGVLYWRSYSSNTNNPATARYALNENNWTYFALIFY